MISMFVKFIPEVKGLRLKNILNGFDVYICIEVMELLLMLNAKSVFNKDKFWI